MTKMAREMQHKGKTRRELIFVNLLRLLAILLVVNSHCEELHPYPALATGGALGNGLFFIISGFLYARSFENRQKVPRFGSWYAKKILRIVPITYVYLFASKAGDLKALIEARDLGQLLWTFLFPTYYWFMGAFCVFLIVYYFVVRSRSRHAMPYAFVTLLILYIAAYVLFVDKTTWSVENSNSFFRWIYYFATMLSGAYVYRRRERLTRFKPWQLFLGAAASVVVMYADKYAMTKSALLMRMQWVNQACVMVFCIFALAWALAMERRKNYHPTTCLLKLGDISKLSWEIYLVHRTLIPFFTGIIFPVNFVLLLVATVLCAAILHWAYDCILKRLSSPWERRRA